MSEHTMESAGMATNGAVSLKWERWGSEGTPLLLVNGLGSPMVAYEVGMISMLIDDGFQVVRFDNRDVGRSTRCDGVDYDVSDMAADGAAVLDAVGWDTAHIVGQSMGGMIAQTMAIDVPERLRSVTSLSSSTGNPDYGAPTGKVLAALTEVPPTDRDGWIEVRLRTEKLWSSAVIDDPTWNRRKAELLYDYGVDPVGSARQYEAIRRSGQRDEALADVTVPFLVLHGSVDTLIDPSGGRRTAECVPDARYVEIDALGHDIPPNFWSRITTDIAGFVRSVSDDLT